MIVSHVETPIDDDWVAGRRPIRTTMYVEVGELNERLSADHGWPIGMAAWSVDKDGNGDIEVHVVRTHDGKADRARHSFRFYGGRNATGVAKAARIALRKTWRGMAGQPEGLPDFDMRATQHVLRAVEAGQADYTALLRSIAAQSISAKLRLTIHCMLNEASAQLRTGSGLGGAVERDY